MKGLRLPQLGESWLAYVRFKGVKNQPYTAQLNHVASPQPLLILQLFTKEA